jgi:hypothetical protein
VVPRTVFSQAALHSFGAFLAVSTSDDYLEEVQAVLQDTEIEQPPPAGPSAPEPTQETDPGDDIDVALNLHETVTQETEDYLLKTWQQTGASFEEVVGAVFEALGYTATVTQASADHGVDVIAHPDALGLERPYISKTAFFWSGRCWFRTSDLCRVNAKRWRRGRSPTFGNTRKTADFSAAHVAIVRRCSRGLVYYWCKQAHRGQLMVDALSIGTPTQETALR